MKTAIYIRVSTDIQVEEGFSISAQKSRLQAYCVAQDWEVVGFYVDEGISAKDMNRPELKRMTEHIEMGLIDCVLVYKLDRLTRSVLDLYTLLELFDKHDCKFKSATEVYDTTTAIGRLFITIVASLAQWERETIGERVRVGLEEKVRQGKYAANIKPFGYSLKDGKLTIIPEEAVIVKRIFSMYIDGYSTSKIANSLSSTPGLKWIDTTILRILKNPIYKGTLRWGRTTGNYFEVEDSVPPIVSEEMFDKVQSHIASRGVQHPRQATSDYIFSGTAKCGVCGKNLVGSTTKNRGKTYRSYRCNGRRYGNCDMTAIPVDVMENLFIEAISNFKVEHEVNEIEIKIDQPVDDREELEQELKTIAKRRKKWQFAWGNDSITDEEFTERMKEENEKEKYLNEKLKGISSPSKTHSNTEIKTLLLNTKENWVVLTDYEKKSLVNILVDYFIVDKSEKNKYEIKNENIRFN